MMPPKIPILKATQFESIRNYYHDMHVLQDLLVPLHKVVDALEWAHREMEVCFTSNFEKSSTRYFIKKVAIY